MAVNYVGIPCTAHGYTVGDTITIDGTTNYDGTYTVATGTTENKILIDAPYVAETFAGTETIRRTRLASADAVIFPGAMNIALAIDTSRTLTIKSTTSTVNINGLPSR